MVAATWAMIHRLNDHLSAASPLTGARALAPLSQDLLVLLAWTQIVGVCLLAPMLSAPLIARERESGSAEHLLLAPLSPLRLVLEKWAAGGLFLLLILIALWPLDLVALLLGNSSFVGLWGVAALGLGCLAWGSALGIACSANARRASLALRSATGIALIWLAGSLVCGVIAGETSFVPASFVVVPKYMAWFGRTNPALCALDLLQPSILPAKWPFCATFLALGTPLFLFAAMRGVRKPLPELHIISPKKDGRGGVSGMLARLEMPLVGRFAPANPVLGREARGKFRLRQPPLPVLVVEIVLALAVALLYVVLAREAWINPTSRETIFWGVAWTGFVVSVLAASAQGGAGLARERENGTWEALQLSLLSPAQIVRGKLVASLATMLLLSFPAWPLLFLCIQWNGAWSATSTYTLTVRGVQPFQFVAAVAIWLGVIWLQTLVGLFFSTRAKKVGGAVGAATGISIAWMLGSLFLFALNARDESALGFLTVVNPLVSLAFATDPPSDYLWASTGWPFATFSLISGFLLLSLIETNIARSMQGERSLNLD